MSTSFKPMKATDVVDTKDLKYPLIASPKIDGVYALVKDGKLLGRSLKPFKNRYITECLSDPAFEGFCGELCMIEPDNLDVARQDLCRMTTSCVNTIEKEWKFIWLLFDYTHPDVIDLPYEERMLVLENYLDILDHPLIEIIPYQTLETAEEVDEVYGKSLDAGFEGLVLRDPEGKWKNGRSTLKQQLFLRMKPQDDFEAIVMDAIEAMENQNEAKINELGYTERSSHKENKIGKGMVGSFKCIDLATGKEIVVGAGKLTHEERIKYWGEVPKNSIIKYKAMTTGQKDLPRFPRFISFRSPEDLDEALYEKYLSLTKE